MSRLLAIQLVPKLLLGNRRVGKLSFPSRTLGAEAELPSKCVAKRELGNEVKCDLFLRV